MAKGETFQDLSLAAPRAGEEFWRWLYSELRGAILDGRLKRGMRLPSTRHLARQYGLSRGTVTAAFDQLRAEGYTETQVGAGTFVASPIPEHAMTVKRSANTRIAPPSRAGLSKRGCHIVENVLLLPASRSVGKAFRSYEPAIDLFPVELWVRIAGRVLRKAPRSLYGQGSIGGYEPLRKAIAEYLGAARGVHCEAKNVVVTSGHSRPWIWFRVCCWIRATWCGPKILDIPERTLCFEQPAPVPFRFRWMNRAWTSMQA
jgi:GntR family transcriptional regulator/MocR family aminotransferase